MCLIIYFCGKQLCSKRDKVHQGSCYYKIKYIFPNLFKSLESDEGFWKYYSNEIWYRL